MEATAHSVRREWHGFLCEGVLTSCNPSGVGKLRTLLVGWLDDVTLTAEELERALAAVLRNSSPPTTPMSLRQ
jgi:hypothetical protein